MIGRWTEGLEVREVERGRRRTLTRGVARTLGSTLRRTSRRRVTLVVRLDRHIIITCADARVQAVCYSDRICQCLLAAVNFYTRRYRNDCIAFTVFTSSVLSKLDIISRLKQLPVCVNRAN